LKVLIRVNLFERGDALEGPFFNGEKGRTPEPARPPTYTERVDPEDSNRVAAGRWSAGFGLSGKTD
jgi:hypothetical protein